MAFNRLKSSTRPEISRHLKLCSYLIFLAIELAIIHQVSDLPVSIGIWLSKAEQLASFQVPSDNFYGPGAALMLAPFLWLSDRLFLVVLFYFVLGTIGYWKITNLIEYRAGRAIAQAALPLNIYLLWLINSSQDTVFEYCLLLWAVYHLLKKRYVSFSALAYFLCLTRAGYWTFFLGSALLLFFMGLIRSKEINLRKLIAIPLLVFTSLLNFISYGSPSPALEGGMTAYFSYSKYYYLSHPKMDFDAFLTGPKGIFADEYGATLKSHKSGAEANSQFQKAAIESALANKKETLLGWMQKIDSYVFDVQKIPHLPGRYVLDVEKKVISIENDRLSWPLVIGNFAFFLYRILLVCAGFLAVGMVLFQKLYSLRVDGFLHKNWGLTLPYIFGMLPGVLFYNETRVKIVSEFLLIPLIVGIWSAILAKRVAKSDLGITT